MKKIKLSDGWYTEYCPFCKADLKSLSHLVVGIMTSPTICPFCGKKIYGGLDDDGSIGWTGEPPIKMMAIAIIGAIVVTAIAVVFFLK